MTPDESHIDPLHERPRLRPPVGLPERGGPRGWRGTAASVAVHMLILILLIVPFFASDSITEVLGAGGAGPAGGGGGGRGGTGGPMVTERLHYVQVAPTPTPAPTVTPVTPPVVPPIVPPVTPPPPKPAETPKTEATPAPATPAAAVTPGTGGGSGNDGSQGNGPGIGGGVGAGEGTGRGNANGPGTGGGPGSVYHAVPNVVMMMPQPVPKKVKGSTIIARFEVDEKGNVLSFDFNQTPDGGYNQKMREMLRVVRFRPATRMDGTPVRDTTTVTFQAY